jgi:hypothetical protein
MAASFFDMPSERLTESTVDPFLNPRLAASKRPSLSVAKSLMVIFNPPSSVTRFMSGP